MVDIYLRSKRRAPFGGLMLTFVLGVVIGLSIGYVVFRGQKPATEAPVASAPPAQEAPAPETAATPPAEAPAAETAAAVAAPPPEPAPQEAPVPVEEAPWPGRFLFLGIEGTSLSDDMKALLKEVRPAGIVLKGEKLGSAEDVAALQQQIADAIGGKKPIFAVDQEGGAKNPLAIEKALAASELGRAKNEDAARDAGRACGEAASGRGIRAVFAPVLNVRDRSKKSVPDADAYVPKARVFGSDQGLVERMGLAFAEGISEKGALPFVKYYPGIGARRKEKDGAAYSLDANSRKLAELMYPFSEAAARNVPGMIVGHIAVPELNRKEPERPASISPVLVQTVLREKFNYKGLVLADDISGDALGAACPPERAVVETLLAGADGAILLDAQPERVRAVCAALQDAMDKGDLGKDRLAHSIDRWDTLLDSAAQGIAAQPKESFAPVNEEPVAAEPPSSPAEKESAPSPTPSVVEAQPIAETPAADTAPAETSAKKTAPIGEVKEESEPVQEPAADTAPASAETSKEEAKAEPVPEKPQEAAKQESAAAAPQEEPKREAAAQPPDTEEVTHEVASGESVSKIAKKYGVREEDVVSWNNMADNNIKAGDKLTIFRPLTKAGAKPSEAKSAAADAGSAEEPMTTHTVEKGETVYRIATRYGITVKRLMAINKLEQPERLVEGQKLRVPANAPARDSKGGA